MKINNLNIGKIKKDAKMILFCSLIGVMGSNFTGCSLLESDNSYINQNYEEPKVKYESVNCIVEDTWYNISYSALSKASISVYNEDYDLECTFDALGASANDLKRLGLLEGDRVVCLVRTTYLESSRKIISRNISSIDFNETYKIDQKKYRK